MSNEKPAVAFKRLPVSYERIYQMRKLSGCGTYQIAPESIASSLALGIAPSP